MADLLTGVLIRIRDRALRSLLVVGLVPLDAILALTLIGWLIMGVGMSVGGMNEFRMPMGLAVGTGVVGAAVLAGVIVAIGWALRTPAWDEEPRDRRAQPGPVRRMFADPRRGTSSCRRGRCGHSAGVVSDRARRMLAEAGENVLPESAAFSGETDLAEYAAEGFGLKLVAYVRSSGSAACS